MYSSGPPQRGQTPPVATVTVNGYNGVEWTQDGMTFWAVSDLNLSELNELKALLERNGV